MKMYTFTTEAVARTALAQVRPALTELAEGQPDKRSMWARQHPKLRRMFGFPYHLGREAISPEYLDESASRLSHTIFTVTLPDDVIWTSRRNDIFAWVTAEWTRLGLGGEPPPELIRAGSWEREWLLRTRLQSEDIPAIVALERRTAAGYPGGSRTRHALALPRKDFN